MEKLIIFQIAPPTQKHKKYKAEVFWKGKRQWVHFGSDQHEHYKDQTDLKLWSHLDHNDKRRREVYYKRHRTTRGLHCSFGAYRHNNGPAGILASTYLW